MMQVVRVLVLLSTFAAVTYSWNKIPYYGNGTAYTLNSLRGGYDVTGDGILDIIVGSPSQAKVFIFTKTTEFASGQPNITLNSPSISTSKFGSSIAVGDCNGDGFPDIFVGAPAEGKVYGFYGNPSGISTTPNVTLSEGLAIYNFGYSIVIGYVNNDTYADLLVGSPNYSLPLLNQGAAFLYHGNASGISTTYSWFDRPSNLGIGFHYGTSVALVDVTGDHLEDAIIGCPDLKISGHEGAIFVYLASTDGLSSDTRNQTIPGTDVNGQFGYYITGVGDTNGDQLNDVAIMAPGENGGNGSLYLYKGNANGLFSTVYFGGSWSAWKVIRSVAPIGDMDNDTYDDVIIGGDGGWAIARGAFGAIDAGVAYSDTDTVGGFGTPLSYAGDIDGDGYLDLLVGASTNGSVFFYATAGEPILAIGNSSQPTPSITPTTTPTPAIPSTTPTSSITGEPGKGKPQNSDHTEAIVGGAVGGAVGLALLGCTAFFVVTKRRRNNQRDAVEEGENSTSSNNIPMQGQQSHHYANAPSVRSSGESPTPRKPSHYENTSFADSNDDESVRKSWKRASNPDSKELQTSQNKNKDEVSAKAEELLAKQWEIEYNDIKLGAQIGEGGFGVVVKARWMGCDCVVKQLNISHDKKAVNDFLKEANTVRQLRNHQNICSIFGVCTNPEYPICIVMEYVAGGNLQTLIYDKTLHLDTLLILKIARDVTGGMSYLHKVNVLHCDLACRNLLVAADTQHGICVKITDFGLSRISHSDVYDASKKSVFPIRWSAPEVLTQLKLSRASDVWSFGVVMWEVLEAKLPYYEMDNPAVIKYVCEEKKVLPKPTAIPYPPAIYDIMLRCWSTEPSERPSFDVLCDLFSEMESSKEIVQHSTQQSTSSHDTYGSRSLSDFRK